MSGDTAPPGTRRRWPVGRVVGCVGAAVTFVLTVAAIGVPLHDANVTEFRAAKKQCLHSFSGLLDAVERERVQASGRAFRPPPQTRPEQPIDGAFNPVVIDCFSSGGVLPVDGEMVSRFEGYRFMATHAWLFSDAPSADDGMSSEVHQLGSVWSVFAEQVNVIGRLPEPGWWETARGVVGW